MSSLISETSMTYVAGVRGEPKKRNDIISAPSLIII